MSKKKMIIYWIATIWLASAMVASGIQQLFQIGGFVEIMNKLQFPVYFSRILGVWKLFGVLILLLPRFPVLKEWAYAGFFFVMSGAIIAHLAMGNPVSEYFVPAFLLMLTCTSWYLRPDSRKLVLIQSHEKPKT